jgi:uncharacterized coiled-coil protein SlyX
MRQTFRVVSRIAGLALLLSSSSYGQSLGDVARQERQKQQAKKDQSAPKVISNEDLPEHTPDASDSGEADQRNESEPHSSPSKSPERWKSQIAAQKQSIAALQSQMERLNSSIHFVEANRYYNGVRYNERQELKQEQVQRMQDQLDQQKKRLDDMQEGARKDGFGNAVYEP